MSIVIPNQKQMKASQLCDQGYICHQKKQSDKAARYYSAALALYPMHFQSLFFFGLLQFEQQQPETALGLLTKAIEADPTHAIVFYNRGVVHHELNHIQEALNDLNTAINLTPDYLKAYELRALVHKKQKNNAEAIHDYTKLIALDPSNPTYIHERGSIYQNLKCYREALLDFESTLKIAPSHYTAIVNTALIMFEMKQYRSAVDIINHAVQIEPKHVDAYHVRAMIAARMGRYHLAEKDYNRCISLGATDPETVFGSALIDLALGNYQTGWEKYEARWNKPNARIVANKKNFTQQQLWRGHSSLQGKTIYIFWEQGLGDTLQFCRYIPMIAALGATILLEVQAPLATFMEAQYGHLATILTEEPKCSFDFVCPLMSLPLAFQTQIDNIPTPDKYLEADPLKRAHWQTRLGDKHKPRVGLVWSGNQNHKNDFHRSLPVSLLETIYCDQFDFIALQKVIRESDQVWLAEHSGIRCFTDEIHDFTDTAALCDLMDIVISVDTSVAHLTGALGKPLWLLLSFTSEWRWMQEKEDNAWYSSARLYRQPRFQAWEDVLHAVQRDLNAHFPI